MWPGTSLRGRATACARLDELVAAVRGGESRSLVLRGEAGIGKTALLEYLVESASDLTIARAVGMESEMELAFASLHQLCWPLLDRLDRLPAPQREALEIVFGMSAGSPPDRFLVGLAVLSLLSEVAEEQPLLCVVDDAQWLDHASELTLGFVARRLLAEPIGLVFAARAPSDALLHVSELEVEGLGTGDAQALLGSAVQFMLDEQVRDRIVAETRGNPLALLELPRELTAAQLAGGFGLPELLPLSGQIEESYLRRLEELPQETRLLLLVAAAEPVGDPALVWRAATQLGVARTALAPAARAGLLQIGAQVRFRHPLVRSAVYRFAAEDDRRSAHEALADVTDPALEPDRRAWHRAAGHAGARRRRRGGARAVRGSCAGPRRACRRWSVPRAGRRPDDRSEPSHRAHAGGGDAQPAGRRVRRGARVAGGRAGRPAGRARTGPRGPAARSDRLRA